ncbi:MAG: hypothetical protein ABSF55_02020 [Candidatus Staskawiczbacteria bacterium]|jgi:hypothetical protein
MPKETIFTQDNKVSKKRATAVIVVLLFVVLVLAISAAVYFYLQNAELRKNPQEIAQQQAKEIVARVSRLILLPQGETPTIATVTDPKLLKDQAFFNNSQKGDQILIYTNAKEAILYRPSSNMIINVAPINIGNTQSSATTPSTSSTQTTAPSTTQTTTKNP